MWLRYYYESSSVFLLLWFFNVFKSYLFNDAVTNSSRHCTVTNTVLERTCKVAPWPIECHYPEVTDRPRGTSVTIITLLFEVRIGCVPNSTQKPYHLNPIVRFSSSYWNSSNGSCNRRRRECAYLLLCTVLDLSCWQFLTFRFCLRGSGFKSHPTYRLSWQIFSWFSTISPRSCRNSSFKVDHG